MPTPLPLTDIVLFDGFDDLDAVGPLEILCAAGFPVRVVRAAEDSGPIRSAHGLAITAAAGLDEQAEMIVVPGGGWFDAGPGARAQVRDGRLPAWLAAQHADGTVITSVCTGALIVSAAGLLQGRPATTNRLALKDLAAGGADVRGDARVVDDGDVVTAGGPSAGLDLGVHLVGRFLGAEAGAQAAQRLEYTLPSAALTTT